MIFPLISKHPLILPDLSDTQHFARFFWSMLEHGVYLPPSQFEGCFISLALEDEMIEETVEAVWLALRESSDV